jgi:hypothetical protein
LVAVAFIAADIIALEVKASKMGQELADRMHGVAAPPGVDYFGPVTVAESQHGFVSGPREIAESSRAGWNVVGKVVEESASWIVQLTLHVRYGKTRARPLSARLSSRLASHHRIACAE